MCGENLGALGVAHSTSSVQANITQSHTHTFATTGHQGKSTSSTTPVGAVFVLLVAIALLIVVVFLSISSRGNDSRGVNINARDGFFEDGEDQVEHLVTWTFIPNNGIWHDGSTSERTATEIYGVIPTPPPLSRRGHEIVEWVVSGNSLTVNWQPIHRASGSSPMLSFENRYYQVVNIGMTWYEARDYAESLGGHLVTITSQAEQDFVQQIVNTYGTQNIFWMGGYWVFGADVNNLATNFRWITGEAASFSAWARGTPDSGDWAYRHSIAFVRRGHEGWGWENYWDDLARHPNMDNPDYTFSIMHIGFIVEWS